jgi:hypothetical protein
MSRARKTPVTLQFEMKPVRLHPSMILHQYWGDEGYSRPKIGVYIIGPTGAYYHSTALLDSGSDFVAFDSRAAREVGLVPPFARSSRNQAAGGASFALSFPDDGVVSLFVTDYRHYCFLPAPLVGFMPPPVEDFAVLGATGFLQYFRLLIDYDMQPPRVQLTARSSFPGVTGRFSARHSLAEQFRRLKLSR